MVKGTHAETWWQYNDGSGIGCYFTDSEGNTDFKYTTSAQVTMNSDLFTNTFWWASNMSLQVKKDCMACWMSGDVVLESGRSFPPRVYTEVKAGDTIVARVGTIEISACG